jgi:Zn-dependent metalloprotease
LLDNPDPKLREIALNTLLATASLRAERRLLSTMGFLPSLAGGKRRTIFDCKTRSNVDDAELIRGESDDPAGDDAVNRAFDGLGSTFDFYEAVFERNSIDDRGMRMDGYVHYRRSYNNAFWNGRQMVFGDGDGVLFTDFTRSLDVIAHELTHGVTEFTAGLEYHNQSGALNESISDVFGSLVKQWALGQNADEADWLIGPEVFTPDVEGDALRSMKSPGQAYDDPRIGRDPQPAHMDAYEQLPDTDEGDWGGVHINSGIPNRAFYLTAIEIGGKAWEAPGRIWYEALRASNFNTEFQDFAETTYSIAGQRFGASSREQQAVLGAWREVGIRVREVAPAAAPTPAVARDGQRAPVLSIARDAGATGPITRQLETLVKELRSMRKELDQIKRRPREPETAKA